jgi:ATP-binding cassette subfamily B protein
MTQRISVYRRLFAYLRPHPWHVLAAYGGMLFATLLNLFVPQIIRQAIDQGLDEGDASKLFWAAGLILGIAVIRGIAGFLTMYNGEWMTFRVAYNLRNDFFRAVQTLPFAFHDKAHTGDLMSRATGDISETERFAGTGMVQLVATVLLTIGVVTAMLLMDPRLALLALPAIVALVIVALRLGRVVEPMWRTIQAQMGVLSTRMQESLTGINVVKAFAREPHEFSTFEEENERWYDKRKGVIVAWGNHFSLFTYILAIGIFILLWFGGPQVINGVITVGTLFAMISYLLMLNGPMQQLGNLVNLAATAGASAGRVFEIIDTPNDIKQKPHAVELKNLAGRVCFDHVSFAYPGGDVEGAHVLKDIDFCAEPGQTIALIGPTGSGKSTVVSLISRFYDPTAGRVMIDGIDVRDATLYSLRSNIGVVLQNPFLFSATIRENIAYGLPEASMDEVRAAARAANAEDFIERFPEGYETRVGERGVTLSGGQKQRIAIARALLYNARILILDDSTSSVDTETEHLIQQALAQLMRNRTTFVIAQRLLTLKSADCILVLDHGRIVERGTHDELLADEGLYRRIYDLQLKAQEEYGQVEQKLAAARVAQNGNSADGSGDANAIPGPPKVSEAKASDKEGRQ